MAVFLGLLYSDNLSESRINTIRLDDDDTKAGGGFVHATSGDDWRNIAELNDDLDYCIYTNIYAK